VFYTPKTINHSVDRLIYQVRCRVSLNDEEEPGCVGEKHGSAVSAVQPADEKICARAAGIFRALGDLSRLRLLSLLAQREMCVTELTECLEDNLAAISQRLKLLRSERIVATRRQGKHIFYRLADSHVAHLIANGLAHGEEPDEQP
jgi:ArsR family transcriptional regulator